MKFYINCRCGCNVMCIEKVIEPTKEHNALYDFNMYRSYDKGNFWYRLKCAWKYFRRGEFAWSDMTIEDKNIDDLVKFLQTAKSSDIVEE